MYRRVLVRSPGPGGRRTCFSAMMGVDVADGMDPRQQADKAPRPTVDLYAATHRFG